MALRLTQPLTEMSTSNLFWGYRRLVRRDDNLTTFMCWFSWNLGASASWNPQGLSRPVTVLLYLLYSKSCGWDSVVGISTRYGLDGQGIEDRRVTRFFGPVQNGPSTHTASYIKGTGFFPGGRRPGRGAVYPPDSSFEVANRLELWFRLSARHGETFTFYLHSLIVTGWKIRG